MKGISQLYRIGYGPSSSHTIAPYRIGELYYTNHPECTSFKIELCGSLALTAMGHGTIDILKRVLRTDKIDFKLNIDNKNNEINITGFKNDVEMETYHGLSLGGGAIWVKEIETEDQIEVYEENSFDEIKTYLNNNKIDLLTYVYSHEPNLKQYLTKCIKTMFKTVENGLNNEGLLNSELNYYRVAKKLFEKANCKNDYLIAYSYATCEENAGGGLMTTAPTLGACGILTSLIYYLNKNEIVEIDKLCDLLAIAGVFGNCIKKNASIAGSTGGCQAEVGTACAMAAAAISYYNGDSLKTIEYAAEMGIEHFLGLTCDPVKGYVIIPCIERNAISILRAFDCVYLAEHLHNIKDNAISFDVVVKAMNYTGSKIAIELRETSLGGLSLEFKNE